MVLTYFIHQPLTDNEGGRFNVHCEAKKIENAKGSSALSTGEDPEDDNNITLIGK